MEKNNKYDSTGKRLKKREDKRTGADTKKNIKVLGVTAAAVILFSMVMTYRMPKEVEKTAFDQNAWKEAVSDAESASVQADKLKEDKKESLSVSKNDTLTDVSEEDTKSTDNLYDASQDTSNKKESKAEDTAAVQTAAEADNANNDSEQKSIERLIMEPPVNGAVVVDYSGDNLVFSKTMHDWRTHNGVDFTADEGTEVKAAADGTIEAITDNGMLGRTVIILHDNNIRSIYSNLAEGNETTVGENVLCGTVIGKVGNTAASEVGEIPHIHFEVSVNEECVNPHDYLNTNAIGNFVDSVNNE